MNISDIVTLLPIPFDVSEIINSFLFMKWEDIVKKSNMKSIRLIRYASLCCSKSESESESESKQIYTFQIEDDYEYQTYIYHITFCTNCGNYCREQLRPLIYFKPFKPLSEKIICKCTR